MVPHETDNPFVFSDGSEFVAEGFFYQWANSFPMYAEGRDCAFVRSDGTMANYACDMKDVNALCFVACPSSEDENSANSGSERSRAKLPLLALFAAGSVFSAFHAIAGLYF